jgi:hypothetical protein
MMTPLMPGVDGGCRTMISGDEPMACTFSNTSGTLLIITPDGKLIPGPALAKDAATQELVDMLVAMFGRSYGSAIEKAEAEEKRATDRARRAEAKLKVAEDRIRELERKYKGA